MRKIKFRGWNKKEKKMYYTDNSKYPEDTRVILPYTGFFGRNGENESFIIARHYMGKVAHETHLVGINDSVIMQSTEQIDDSTEREEIYEGDILYAHEIEMYVDVFWDDGAFCILFDNEDETTVLTQQIIKANHLIKVGNVYENLKLLIKENAS